MLQTSSNTLLKHNWNKSNWNTISKYYQNTIEMIFKLYLDTIHFLTYSYNYTQKTVSPLAVEEFRKVWFTTTTFV
jgi:hypothetical protein